MKPVKPEVGCSLDVDDGTLDAMNGEFRPKPEGALGPLPLSWLEVCASADGRKGVEANADREATVDSEVVLAAGCPNIDFDPNSPGPGESAKLVEKEGACSPNFTEVEGAAFSPNRFEIGE